MGFFSRFTHHALHFSSRTGSPWFIFILTTLLVLLVYLLTLAPDLTWANYGGDGGELITAAVTLGIPHPPGYPTYVILGKLVSLLPVGTMAWRFNLLSAICVALAAGVISIIRYQRSANGESLTARRFLITGFLFAFTPVVWSQALIAEVYGLDVLLVALFLWALWQKRPFLLTGLLLGLSVTTHLTSLLLLPLALALTPARQWPRLSAGLVLGLAPFLLLPLLARGSSPVVWGEPTTLSGWWWLVSGQIYHANAFALPFNQWLPRLAEWAWLLIAYAGLQAGRYAGEKVGKYKSGQVGKPVNLQTCRPANLQTPIPANLPILHLTFWLYTIYAFFYNTPDAIVLLLPAVLLLALMLAPLLSWPGRWAWLLPILLLLLNFNGQNLRDDPGVRSPALATLQTAPDQAILLAPGNETIFALWYFQSVEGVRRDISLVDENLFAFAWYRTRLQELHPHLKYLAQDDLDGFRRENSRLRPVLAVDLWAENGIGE